MQWFKDRMSERTTLDGTVMVVGGLVLLLLPATVVKIVAGCALAYGAYTLIMKG
jgi:hypothetical protein|tara:strand:+ start:6233 stop:6394 length:162 start_codon:yes stop_codon:yes gene_type:complete